MHLARILLAIAALAIAPARADDTILHFFTGGGTDGAVPQGDLVASGSILYGMTANGGLNNSGTVFRLDSDGSGFATLLSFSPGSNPSGSLALSGSTLYGMTNGGGTGGAGAIFRVESSGTGFSELHSFTGGAADGSSPLGSLILSGSTLYGMTQFGGANGTGTIFRINADGSGFNLLHSFAGGATDGSLPFGSLTLSGSTLYGMTANGGSANGGVVFRIDVSGAGFDVLHSFTGGAADGGNPQGSLLFSESTLYGTSIAGGASGAGTVFKLDADGGNFALLHSFAGGGADGSLPSGSLTLAGSTLYGTTQGGGPADHGTVFKIGLDGTSFALVHGFAGGAADGANPQGSLILLDGQLYGTSSSGGATNNGTAFSLVAIPEPSAIALSVAGLAMLALQPLRQWRKSRPNLRRL